MPPVVRRVNVSLDTLDDQKLPISHAGAACPIPARIDAPQNAGLRVKINAGAT